jgi:membrane-bound lytic murein transglycosylase F
MRLSVRHRRRPSTHRGVLGWVLYSAIWGAFLSTAYSAYRFHLLELPVRGEAVAEARISSYDAIIQKYAKAHGLDWRLIASMIWAESSFRHDAVSPAGALGLMQIMPAVAREQGTEFSAHPEENIRAGIGHFASKLRRIKGRTPGDTLRLSLAAYNVGLGHLRDAQNLAMENGKSPRVWEDVSQMFELLEMPDYYTKSKYGYCQGSSVVEYVARVFQKFNTYATLYPRTVVQVSQAEAATVPRT